MNKPYIKLICIILKYLTYKEYLNIYTHYQYHTVLLFALNFTVVQLIISPFVYYDCTKNLWGAQNAAALPSAGASKAAAVLLAGAAKAAASPLAGASKAEAVLFAGAAKAAASPLAGASKAAAVLFAGAAKAAASLAAGASKAAAVL